VGTGQATACRAPTTRIDDAPMTGRSGTWPQVSHSGGDPQRTEASCDTPDSTHSDPGGVPAWQAGAVEPGPVRAPYDGLPGSSARPCRPVLPARTG
jgi:hypothetical protein